jgi:16S rRNA (adenine1518-N6/adenine1519-N6)-dimethyltransferase
VLVSFKRHSRPPVAVHDPTRFVRFVHKAFAHRRKTLRNSLAAAGFPVPALEQALDVTGVDPRARPEQVGLETFADLYRRLH